MIQIDIKMPESCYECPIKSVEEDFAVDYFYYCPLVKVAISGKERFKQRHKDCPLKEVKELNNE